MPASRACAFTLVELLVVVLLLSTLAVAAMPFLSTTMEQFRATALAREIAADVRYAQSLAVQTGQQYRISFDTAGQGYQVNVWSGGTWQAASHPLTKKAWSVSLAAGSPWSGLRVTQAAFGPNSCVVFDKYGAPDNGGSVTLTFGPSTRTIQVAPLSGRVTVQ